MSTEERLETAVVAGARQLVGANLSAVVYGCLAQHADDQPQEFDPLDLQVVTLRAGDANEWVCVSWGRSGHDWAPQPLSVLDSRDVEADLQNYQTFDMASDVIWRRHIGYAIQRVRVLSEYSVTPCALALDFSKGTVVLGTADHAVPEFAGRFVCGDDFLVAAFDRAEEVEGLDLPILWDSARETGA